MPDCTYWMLRVTPGGGAVLPNLPRRSSARSMIEYLKHGSTSRGSSLSGRPLSSSALPFATQRRAASGRLAGSLAMKDGTSTITLADGCALSRSPQQRFADHVQRHPAARWPARPRRRRSAAPGVEGRVALQREDRQPRRADGVVAVDERRVAQRHLARMATSDTTISLVLRFGSRGSGTGTATCAAPSNTTSAPHRSRSAGSGTPRWRRTMSRSSAFERSAGLQLDGVEPAGHAVDAVQRVAGHRARPTAAGPAPNRCRAGRSSCSARSARRCGTGVSRSRDRLVEHVEHAQRRRRRRHLELVAVRPGRPLIVTLMPSTSIALPVV